MDRESLQRHWARQTTTVLMRWCDNNPEPEDETEYERILFHVILSGIEMYEENIARVRLKHSMN